MARRLTRKRKGEINAALLALDPRERRLYAMLVEAAEQGRQCPLNLDIEVDLGFNSTAMGPKMIRKLEERGLIRVMRFQKYRIVEIIATGQQTARSPSMHVTRPHVPRTKESAHA